MNNKITRAKTAFEKFTRLAKGLTPQEIENLELLLDKKTIRQLKESMADSARGEVIPLDEVEKLLMKK